MADKQTRESFGSRIGFVIAAAGSAVGLGNLWKFPYLAGMNGGAAFLFIYIVIVLCIGVTAMMCEVVVGRMGGLNAADSFEKLGGKRWKPVGWSGIACAFVILSYYAVIGGWIIRYMLHSFTGLIELAAQGKSAEVFSVFVSNTGEVVFYQALFLVITASLVLMGVKNGIEKSCKIMMPMLFIAMLILIARSVTLPGAVKGIEFYLYPDFSKVTPQTVLAALGQGFFSLSLGAGAILIYGSYLPKTANIIKIDKREEELRAARTRSRKHSNRRHLADLSSCAFADFFKPLIIVALNTGIRRTALFSLKWEDVDFATETITLRAETAKSGKSAIVPMNRIVVDTLQKWRKQSREEYVFPSPDTGGPLDNCTKTWTAVLKAANIKNFRWHDMRHDFASQLVMKGVDLNTVRELMTHSDIKTTLIYAHLAPEKKKSAVDLLCG